MGAGDHLMDVVPSQATLVVDSRLKVDLIDKVYNGLPVDLMFTAFNQKQNPENSGNGHAGFRRSSGRQNQWRTLLPDAGHGLAGGHENAQWRGHQAGDAGGSVRENGVTLAAELSV